MADLQGRLSPSCLEEFEDESLDPRIQVELERLNGASEEINKLELELDDARASFRQTLSDTTHKLDAIGRKLGSFVEKARPYYDARMRAKEVQVETQKAAYMYERACSMHEAAKEMVQVAEQGYMQREEISDSAWQEMLNHATMKVNEAEKDRLESEGEHRKMTMKFKVAQDVVQKLQQELKRSINKSKPYFEMKAKFNQQMEDQKRSVTKLEKEVIASKNMYSEALRNLEEISEEIHRQRLEQRNKEELGVREAGVGSESPSPPPMRGSEPLSIDGKTIQIAGSCSTGASQTTVTSSQSGTEFRSSQEVHLPSVIYSSPDKARTPSYRKAIESRQSMQSPESERSQILDSVDESYCVNLDDEYLALPCNASVKDNTDGGRDSASNEDVFQKHPPADSERIRRVSDTRRKQSHQEDISHISEGYVGEVTPKHISGDDTSKNKTRDTTPLTASEKAKKPPKLQGLILQIGPGSNPLATAPQLKKPARGGSGVGQDTEPLAAKRPASFPYSHNTQVTKQTLPAQVTKQTLPVVPTVVTPDERKTVVRSDSKSSISSEKNERRLLKAPSMHDFDDTSVSEFSDTESIASGTMLDDDQVEFLTMDFSRQRVDSPDVADRSHWARMSLPTDLSHLQNYIRQVSGEHRRGEGLSPSDDTEAWPSPSEQTQAQDSDLTVTGRSVSQDNTPCVIDDDAEKFNIQEEATTRL